MTVTNNRSRARVKPAEFDDDEPPFDTDERPASRRSRREDEEERSRPTSSSRSRRNVRDDDVDPERNADSGLDEFTKGREEDVDADEDEEETLVVPIFKGYKAAKENRPGQDGSLYFKWLEDGESQVVKFLPGKPWFFNQHWVTRQGKQSFPCIGDDCPLCEVGVKVTQKAVYDILNLSHADGPTVQTLEVSSTLADTLKAYDEDRKTGPLSRLYWSLARTKATRSSGSFAKYNYNFLPIKERDLEEDYNIPLARAEEALDVAEPIDPSKVIGRITRRGLQEIADEIMG